MSSACTPVLVGMVSPVSGDKISKTAKLFRSWTKMVEKFNRSESAQKIYVSRVMDVNACTPILVGMTSPVSEILLLSKTANFPFDPWTIVHGNQKI